MTSIRSEWALSVRKRNAAVTKIKNEDDIDFDFEPNQKLFTAFTRKPLEVVNQATGYRVIYDLQSFESNYETQTQHYFGIPRFEELKDKTKGRWKRERERAYNGSMMQFIHLLLKGNMNDEFDVYEFFRNPNPERPPTNYLKEKIKYWAQNQLLESGSINNKRSASSDSLDYTPATSPSSSKSPKTATKPGWRWIPASA